eukprot:TRINITY_DN2927_c1_g1_i1.p1 TRINITY_DN2927_c1_g1~~TRINITY_DN2927_c1_g1_i1.p1  ORF type:complete len:796 (-),score=146.83 TRINITY_DN2927_c1_g1_i1:58-2415(-)
MPLTPRRAAHIVEHFRHQQRRESEVLLVDTCELLESAPEETRALFEDFDTGCALLQRTLAEPGLRQEGPTSDQLGHSTGTGTSPKLRFVHVPGCLGLAVRSVGELRAGSVGHYINASGIVTKLGGVKAAEHSRVFQCAACGYRMFVRARIDMGCRFELPQACPGGGSCGASQFLDVGVPDMMDYQEISLQDSEAPGQSGGAPRSVKVVLTEDLVGMVSPGDNVVVGGVVRTRWQQVHLGQRVGLELLVEANHVRVLGSRNCLPPAAHSHLREKFEEIWQAYAHDEFTRRSKLVQSAAPCLQNLNVPKLALLLTLIGGSSLPKDEVAMSEDLDKWKRYLENNRMPLESAMLGVSQASQAHEVAAPSASQRSSLATSSKVAGGRLMPHLLLIGEPGTGKSKLLQAACALSNQGVMTGGVGATKSGLTFSCVRDGSSWSLEVGALSLADGGVCCIDEFSHIAQEERAVLHEAMEQQSISVAKPGLVCRLRSRCSIIAAQSSPAQPNSDAQSTFIGSMQQPLLSRFDLVLGFRSERGATDKALVDSLLASRPHSMEANEIDVQVLRNFLVRTRDVVLSAETDAGASLVLERYYAALRRASGEGAGLRSEAVVTVRTLESLLRLAQAHARLLRHEGVQLQDAVAVVFLHQLATRSHSPCSEQVLLTSTVLGLNCPSKLKAMDLHTDISCLKDYEVVEGAILWILGLRKDLQTGFINIVRGLVPGGPTVPPSRALRPSHQIASETRTVLHDLDASSSWVSDLEDEELSWGLPSMCRSGQKRMRFWDEESQD